MFWLSSVKNSVFNRALLLLCQTLMLYRAGSKLLPTDTSTENTQRPWLSHLTNHIPERQLKQRESERVT